MHYHISGNYNDSGMREGVTRVLWGEWCKYGLDEAVQVAQSLTNAQVTSCVEGYPDCVRQIRVEARRAHEPWPQQGLGYSGLGV